MKYWDRLTDGDLAICLFPWVIPRQTLRIRNYTPKHLESTDFRSFLADVNGSGVPLSMDGMIERCEAGAGFPPRSFAITFDHGFENNFSVAVPILTDLGPPATFYVSTGYVADNAMSWVDRIESILEEAPGSSVRLPRDGSPRPIGTDQEKNALLRKKAGVGPSQYSHPENLAHCFDERVIAYRKARGVRCCPTAMEGVNARGADAFRLRRIFVV